MKNWFVLVIALGLVATGCLAPEPVIPPAPTPIERLVFAMFPTEEQTVVDTEFVPFMEFLSKQLGIEVELRMTADYPAVVEALKYGHADIVRLSAFNYVLATQQTDVEALAADMKSSLGSAKYVGLIIARADRHITDLKGRSFAYVDVGSTSGYLLPATYFKKEGIEIGDTFFAGSHPAVIQAVLNGTVDAGATADNRLRVALQEGVIKEGEIEVLWTSAPVPSPPICVPRSMDADLKERIRQAFLAMPPEILENCGWDAIGFEEVSDSDYDVIREIQETLGLGPE